MIADIIIPQGPRHTHTKTAIQSARRQSLPCKPIIINDQQGRGPAVARNEGLERATAPFVVFLDADDSIEPAFVEICLKRYETGHYVYTSWTSDTADYVHVPKPGNNIFENGLTHCITTLLPREAALAIGGFDESLHGLEDVDFYMRLHQLGICGLHVDEPLFHYNRLQGDSVVSPRRNKVAVDQSVAEIYNLLKAKYDRTWGLNMCKCNENTNNYDRSAKGSDADIQVMLLPGVTPSRFSGPATKRVYPKPPKSKPFWMHPADAQVLSSGQYRGRIKVHVLPDIANISPDMQTVLDLLNDYGGSA